MQTTTFNPASPALSPNNAAQRNNAANAANGANAAADAGQFSAMLSNQLTQAPAMPQPPVAQAPAPKPQAPKPAQPDPAPAPAPQANAGQDKTASTDGAKDADAKEGDEEDDAGKSAAAQAPADPASAMLALLASLQPGAKPAATPAGAAQAFDNLGGNAGKGKRFDAGQLSALQAAIKSTSKDATGAAAGAADKGFGAAVKNAALGAGAAALDKAGAAGADMAAAGDVLGKVSATALKADPGVALDAAALSLQQARAAAEQAAQNAAPVASVLQAQPAVLEAAQAVAASDQMGQELSAQVGTDAWENQLGQKVVYMIGSEDQTASLTLNPPDLGPMQVVLSVSNDQASVSFSSNQEEVRQALENALPRLREMMSESGIALGNASVNAGMPDGRQAQQQDSSPRGGRNYGRANGAGAVESADAAAPRVVARSTLLGDRGMVDTFA